MALVLPTSDLDVVIRALLKGGARLTEITKQPQYEPPPIEKQGRVINVVVKGLYDQMPLDRTFSIRAIADNVKPKPPLLNANQLSIRNSH